MSKTVKVAVTGAAGQIGYALLPCLLRGAVGPDTTVDLQLLEVTPALPAAASRDSSSRSTVRSSGSNSGASGSVTPYTA